MALKMLSTQADRIVRDCIRLVTSFSGKIEGQNKLSESEVSTDLILDRLIDTIVHHPGIGVGSFGFSIDSASFDRVSLGTKVFEVIDIVAANALPNLDPPELYGGGGHGAGEIP